MQLTLWGFDNDGRTVATGRRIVYFLRDPVRQKIKIGFTTGDVRDRMADLQTGCADAYELLGSIVVRDDEDDRRLHKRFAIFHYRGEWFNETSELLLAIQELMERQRDMSHDTPIDLPVRVRPDIGQYVAAGFDCRRCRRSLFCVFGIVVRENWSGTVSCSRCGHRMPVNLVVDHCS